MSQTDKTKFQYKFPKKLTKIVATIGPATETKEILREMILAGMNVARFNSKHGTPEWHHERIVRVKEVARELNAHIGVLLDLQGPEVRVTLPKQAQEKGYCLEKDETIFFTTQENPVIKSEVYAFAPVEIVELVKPGQIILIDDGLCELKVKKLGEGYFEAEAVTQSIVKNRKTMSFPELVTDMPVLIENDYVQLDGIHNNEVDYVALSFVRNKKDILTLRQELDKRNLTAKIVAKIENQEAMNNLNEIIQVSDVVMIARGDLAIEVPYEKLIKYQRTIIKKCREQAKPVITATHMLETMTTNPFPTRAEISDVAHAVYDLTDAVMLSGETTIGKYPVKTVTVQAKIVAYNEKFIEPDYMECVTDNCASNITNAVSRITTKGLFDVDFVVCLTESGRTATLISRNRPKMPVHVITRTQEVADRLSVIFGLIPHVVDWPEGEEMMNADQIMKKLLKYHWFKSGKKALLIHGSAWGKSGHTNTMSIVTIK